MLSRLRTIFITRRKRYEYLLSTKKQLPTTKFIILCQPRTGSTLLHTYLNSHPAIFSYGEVIRRTIEKNNKSHHSIKSLVFKPHQSAIQAVGCKIFYDYSEQEHYQRYFQEILADTSIKVIHLVRENLLDVFTSLVIAEETDKWHSTKTQSNDVQTTISVDPDLFRSFLENFSSQQANIKALFHQHDLLEISYNALAEAPKEILHNVQDFLNLPRKRLFSLLKKQHLNTSSKINNYVVLEELYEAHLLQGA